MPRKMSGWNGPLTIRRYLDPTGPLADVDGGYCYDFTKQRAIVPEPIGSKYQDEYHMNSSGTAAHAILTTPETHGTESPLKFPK